MVVGIKEGVVEGVALGIRLGNDNGTLVVGIHVGRVGLNEGTCIGMLVGVQEGICVGCVGTSDGSLVGLPVGVKVGERVGRADGLSEGF